MITPEERKYLVESISKLLSDYGYKHTEEALNKIIDRWEEQKAPLIDAFKKHPNYVKGQFMIADVKEYERAKDIDAIIDFSSWLNRKALRRTDICPREIFARRGSCTYLPAELWDFLDELYRFADRCISTDTYNYLKKAIPEVRVHVGEKTSRVVGRICKYMKYDTIEGYEKAFAAYSDALNPIKFKRNIVLSINPLDYLTMSFGNSWSSCHTIDKKNKRGMPNSYEGMYSAGTMSYMLDPSSMVFYTIDDGYDRKEYWTQPKIHRQMFHYENAKLLQGRLYPQNSSTEQYEQYRNTVRDILSNVFDLRGEWGDPQGYDFYKHRIVHIGVHYPDYYHFGQCRMICFGMPDYNKINIGSKPICVRCGEEHDFEGQIDHCVYRKCKTCGRIMNESDAIVINGEAYCDRHAHPCACCGALHPETEMQYVSSENGYVCRDCLAEQFTQCDGCHNYYRKSKLHVVGNQCLCPNCKRYAEKPHNKFYYNGHYYWFNDHDWEEMYDRARFIIGNHESIEIRYETDDDTAQD